MLNWTNSTQLEKERIIHNILKEFVKPNHTISIIGIAKNAGKTTVLNQLIFELKEKIIAITSIGLDGEKIDNVTSLPKPQIKVFKSMLIATALSCLNECTFKYVLHEKTNIRTSLGEVVIVEALTSGTALIAGPSRKNDMKILVTKLKKYKPTNIIIDGAIFRKSFASSEISDSIILSTGGSYNSDMEVVVKDTKLLIDQIDIKRVDEGLYNILKPINYNAVIDKENRVIKVPSFWDNSYKKEIKRLVNKDVISLYIHGGLTNKVIKILIDLRFEIRNLSIIISDATHIICDKNHYKKLEILGVKVLCKNKLELLFVAYNPTSPNRKEFNNLEFGNLLKKSSDFRFINVIEDWK